MILKDFDLRKTLRKLMWLGSIRVPAPEDPEDWPIGDDYDWHIEDDYYYDPNTHEPVESFVKIELEMLIDLIARADKDLKDVEDVFDLALLLEEKVACAIAYNLSTGRTEWRWLVVEAVLEAITSKNIYVATDGEGSSNNLEKILNKLGEFEKRIQERRY